MPLLKFEAFLVIVLDHHRQQKTKLSMLTNIVGILPLIHLCLIFSYLNHTYRRFDGLNLVSLSRFHSKYKHFTFIGNELVQMYREKIRICFHTLLPNI